MFSGIIEYLGTIASVDRFGQGKRLAVESGPLAEGMRAGDSLAVNGVCLTAVAVHNTVAEFEAAAETLSKTNLGLLVPGIRVNLERPLKAEGRVHGHLVAGHVDSTSRVLKIRKQPESTLISFELNEEIRSYVVARGSVAVDGVSLTVSRLDQASFACSLIGYTLSHTNLGIRKTGEMVNVETDIIGKYVVSVLERMGFSGGGITEDKLREWGY
jgi:riboflavin synthase